MNVDSLGLKHHSNDHTLINKLVLLFKALSDHTRLMIIRILASNMKDKISVTDLSEIFSISQPAVSQHLKILSNIGLLDRKKEGNSVYYYVNINELNEFKINIDEMFKFIFKKCQYFPNCVMIKSKDKKEVKKKDE
ncbi:MAG: metalloregulator ArsR/SmtB family transcription factor [Candidatus Lokiarchaeota archaeon]|nr:metalloregulator ArsR/SmtB family transcription factor [Candidatus Lokiarchaeota archaeon]